MKKKQILCCLLSVNMVLSMILPSMAVCAEESEVFAGYCNTPITIDGILNEKAWENTAALVCDNAEQVVVLTEWNGAEDLSGIHRLMWDEKFLYLSATVTDNVFSQEYEIGSIWQGDSVQLGIYDDTKMMRSASALPSFEEIGLALVKGEPVAYRFGTLGMSSSGEIKQDDNFAFACVRSENKTIYEMKISWVKLLGYGYSPKNGDSIGFSVIINDNDNDARRSYVEYGSGIGGIKNAKEFVIMPLLDKFGDTANNVYVTCNGKNVYFDVKPIIEDGRVLVPVRAIFNQLGAKVEWDPDTKTVLSNMGDRNVSLTIDEASVTVNGEVRAIDVPARIIDGRTLVPVRAISEAYDCDVKWDGTTRTVTITKK